MFAAGGDPPGNSLGTWVYGTETHLKKMQWPAAKKSIAYKASKKIIDNLI